MKYKRHIVALSLLTLTLFATFPISTQAQALPVLPNGRVPGTEALNFLPTVPISNPAYEAKETGISIFGFSIPISWDGLAIAIAKQFIQALTTSTVNWINNGFNGNPGYVTNPKQYFTDIADGVAGQFISGTSELSFLCSPFQTQVRLALRSHYLQENRYQCTLTQVIGNIDAFYNDFNQGGWDAWFAMTQNNSNNPYGSIVEAQMDLDTRIASAIGVNKEQLDWNKGFLSWQKCKPEFVLTQADINNGYGAEGYKAGDCFDDGSGNNKRSVTPGVVIESQLENVLGTGLHQLELADEFDELVSSLMGQLLSKSVFSIQGLLQ